MCLSVTRFVVHVDAYEGGRRLTVRDEMELRSQPPNRSKDPTKLPEAQEEDYLQRDLERIQKSVRHSEMRRERER